ncbi:L,D-transpeptidase [Consotaella salsifontis]|uniref:Lipoprotein-anchoring transpeptidase ErfK/SrfK n=1 Tax=Consotaella salsifontis TaxID=1365950 RepID=A0A1T4NMQ6_9HYPH|nr:L,D-transpeptidase [Consotaella salsifontis]SJZ80611.1 Lipoprotein-anchoring transpeptidase ErfK/SrfK [Consotaella salsifontis]
MSSHKNDGAAPSLSRRQLLVGLSLGATALAAGCSSVGPRARVVLQPGAGDPYAGYDGSPSRYAAAYGPIEDGGFRIPGIDLRRVDKRYLRQEVADPTGEAPGTIVIDTPSRYAYLVMPGGRAMRYGVGIGRQGFSWGGRAKIQMKRKWPTWTPPSEMIARQPELTKYADGMDPGLTNPLGARALYLFQNGRDTLYRLHGTPEYWTIGKAVSSGCVRFMNHDIIDLYDRVPVGTDVVVRQGGVA